MATGGSTNVAMVGQIAVSDQVSSAEQSQVPSSERALETVQRTGTTTAVAEAQAPAAVSNGELGARAAATAIPRTVSDEGSEGSDRGRSILIPSQVETSVVPRPRSRSLTPVAVRVGQPDAGRSTGFATPGSHVVASRHSGRSTPKGGNGADSFKVIGGAEEKLQAELRKIRSQVANPSAWSNCSVADLPEGIPEQYMT